MKRSDSYRSILKGTSVVGAASLLNLITGLLKMKAAAVLLGPSGVGLISLLQNMMTVIANVAGLGLAPAGKREIAEAHGNDDEEKLLRTRQALFWGTIALASVGTIGVLVLSNPISVYFLGSATSVDHVSWLAIGVFVSVAAGSQGALLSGMRRIKELALVQIYGSTSSLALGVAALAIGGEEGIIPFVLSAPVAAFFWGHWYARRVPRARRCPLQLTGLLKEWQAMLGLSLAFMLSGLIAAGGLLAARIIIQAELGLDQLGYFQAALLISSSYIGFLLASLSTDFFSRLSAAVTGVEDVNHLVNEQTEVVLLLSGPLIVAMIALAPITLSLLYSPDFVGAASVLRWQLLGDIPKVLYAPLSFVLLASRRGKLYVVIETVGMFAFIAFVALFSSSLGLLASGVGYALMHIVALPLFYIAVVRVSGYRLDSARLTQALAVAAAAAFIILLAEVGEAYALVSGLCFSFVLASYSARRLLSRSGTNGLINKLGGRWRTLIRHRDGVATSEDGSLRAQDGS